MIGGFGGLGFIGRPAGQKKGACRGENPHLAGSTIKFLTHQIGAPAQQRYLVGLALLMTHGPGHIITHAMMAKKLSVSKMCYQIFDLGALAQSQ